MVEFEVVGFDHGIDRLGIAGVGQEAYVWQFS